MICFVLYRIELVMKWQNILCHRLKLQNVTQTSRWRRNKKDKSRSKYVKNGMTYHSDVLISMNDSRNVLVTT